VQEQIPDVRVKEKDLVKQGQVLGTLQPCIYQKALGKVFDLLKQKQ
jgi:multidrug resistance efflux pump